MKLLRQTNIRNPKLIYDTTLDHSQDSIARRMDDRAWQATLTLGHTMAIVEWQKFVAAGFTGGQPNVHQIICESQDRTNSYEVYYSIEVANKMVRLQYFVE